MEWHEESSVNVDSFFIFSANNQSGNLCYGIQINGIEIYNFYKNSTAGRSDSGEVTIPVGVVEKNTNIRFRAWGYHNYDGAYYYPANCTLLFYSF